MSTCASQFLAWSLDVATVLNLGDYLVTFLHTWCLSFWLGGATEIRHPLARLWGVWSQFWSCCLILEICSGKIEKWSGSREFWSQLWVWPWIKCLALCNIPCPPCMIRAHPLRKSAQLQDLWSCIQVSEIIWTIFLWVPHWLGEYIETNLFHLTLCRLQRPSPKIEHCQYISGCFKSEGIFHVGTPEFLF